VILQMHPRCYFNCLTEMSYHNLLFDSDPPSWYLPFTWNEWKILYWERLPSWNWCHVQEKSL
jgi:hypothetical protein